MWPLLRIYRKLPRSLALTYHSYGQTMQHRQQQSRLPCSTGPARPAWRRRHSIVELAQVCYQILLQISTPAVLGPLRTVSPTCQRQSQATSRCMKLHTLQNHSQTQQACFPCFPERVATALPVTSTLLSIKPKPVTSGAEPTAPLPCRHRLRP